MIPASYALCAFHLWPWIQNAEPCMTFQVNKERAADTEVRTISKQRESREDVLERVRAAHSKLYTLNPKNSEFFEILHRESEAPDRTKRETRNAER